MNELLLMIEVYWNQFIDWITGNDDDDDYGDLIPA